MGRNLIVGDIHGCRQELNTLLTRLEVRKNDTLICVGDLVDRGPDSLGVLRDLREVEESGVKVVVVAGNHEKNHARFRRFLNRGQEEEKGLRNYGFFHRFHHSLSKEDVEFLDKAVLYHEIPEHSSVVIHGGLPTRMTELPGVKLLKEVFGDRRLLREQCLAMVSLRFENPDGDRVYLGEEEADDEFWASNYDGWAGEVYYGHEPYTEPSEPQDWYHATGIDTGCVFGGKLTAVILQPDEPGDPRFVSVPALRRYARCLERGRRSYAE